MGYFHERSCMSLVKSIIIQSFYEESKFRSKDSFICKRVSFNLFRAGRIIDKTHDVEQSLNINNPILVKLIFTVNRYIQLING